jgi:hypothetical protein
MFNTLTSTVRKVFSDVIVKPLSYNHAMSSTERKIIQLSRGFVFTGCIVGIVALVLAMINFEYFIIAAAPVMLFLKDENVVASAYVVK